MMENKISNPNSTSYKRTGDSQIFLYVWAWVIVFALLGTLTVLLCSKIDNFIARNRLDLFLFWLTSFLASMILYGIIRGFLFEIILKKLLKLKRERVTIKGDIHWWKLLSVFSIFISSLLSLVAWYKEPVFVPFFLFVMFFLIEALLKMRATPSPVQPTVEEKKEFEAKFLDVISAIRIHPFYKGQIVFERKIEEKRQPPLSDAKENEEKPYSQTLEKILKKIKKELYRHQVEALKNLNDEKSVFIMTPLGSGKSFLTLLAAVEWIVQGKGSVIFMLPDDESVNFVYKSVRNAFEEFGELGIIVRKIIKNQSVYEVLNIETAQPISLCELVLTTVGEFQKETKEFLEKNSTYPVYLHTGIPLIVIEEVMEFSQSQLMIISAITRLLNSKFRESTGKSPLYLLTSSLTLKSYETFAEKLTSTSPIECITADFSPVKEKRVSVWLPPMERMETVGKAKVRLQRRNYSEEIKDLTSMLMALGENVLLIASGIPFKRSKRAEILKTLQEKEIEMRKGIEELDRPIGNIDIVGNIYEVSEYALSKRFKASSIVITGFSPYLMDFFREIAHLGDNFALKRENESKQTNIFVVPADHPIEQFIMKALRGHASAPAAVPQIPFVPYDEEFLKFFLSVNCPSQGYRSEELETLIPFVKPESLKIQNGFRLFFKDKNRYKLSRYANELISAFIKYRESNFIGRISLNAYKLVPVQRKEEIIGYVSDDFVHNIAMQDFVLMLEDQTYLVRDVDTEKKVIFLEAKDVNDITHKQSRIKIKKVSKYNSLNIDKGEKSVPYKVIEFGKSLIIEEKYSGYKKIPYGLDLTKVEIVNTIPLTLNKEGVRTIKVENAFMLKFNFKKIAERSDNLAEELKKKNEWLESPFNEADKEHLQLGNKEHKLKVLHTVIHAMKAALDGIVFKSSDKVEIRTVEFQESESKEGYGDLGILFFDSYENSGVTQILRSEISTLLEYAYKILVSCPCTVGCAICLGTPSCAEPFDKYVEDWEVDRKFSDARKKGKVTNAYYELVNESGFDKLNAILVLGSAIGKLDEALEHKFFKLHGIGTLSYLLKEFDEIREVVENRFSFIVDSQSLGGKKQVCTFYVPEKDKPTVAIRAESSGDKNDLAKYLPTENRIEIIPSLREEEWFDVLAHEYFHVLEFKGELKNCDFKMEGMSTYDRLPGLYQIKRFLERKGAFGNDENFLILFPLEGFAQWGAYKLLEYYGLKCQMISDKFWTDIETYFRNKSEIEIKKKFPAGVYGGGFLFFFHMEQKLGFNETLKFILTKKLTGKSELELYKLFENLLNKSGIRDLIFSQPQQDFRKTENKI